MKTILEVRSKALLEQSAEDKHNKVIALLNEIGSPWGLNNAVIPFPGFGKEIIAQVVLDKKIGKGIKCTVFYKYRSKLEDDSFYDDRMYLEFNSSKIDFAKLRDEILPNYIYIFNAYRAEIYSEDIMFADFEKMHHINLRNEIVRVCPVGFYDEGLCIQAFGLSSGIIVERLNNKVKVKKMNNGILIGDNMLGSLEEANEFSSKILSLLK